MKRIYKSIDRGMFISFICFLTFTIFINNLILIDWSEGVYMDNFILGMSIGLFVLLVGITSFTFLENVKFFVRKYRWLRTNP